MLWIGRGARYARPMFGSTRVLPFALICLVGCGIDAHRAAGEGGLDSPPADAREPARVGPATEVRSATAEQVLEAVRRPGATVVLLNVWATWCGPCREEFPDLVDLHRIHRDRGLRLILVSADFDDQLPQARRFLASQGVDVPSYLKVGDDMHFINTLNPRWTGALPATFLYDGRGRLRYFREGKTVRRALEQQILAVVSDTLNLPKGDPS